VKEEDEVPFEVDYGNRKKKKEEGGGT